MIIDCCLYLWVVPVKLNSAFNRRFFSKNIHLGLFSKPPNDSLWIPLLPNSGPFLPCIVRHNLWLVRAFREWCFSHPHICIKVCDIGTAAHLRYFPISILEPYSMFLIIFCIRPEKICGDVVLCRKGICKATRRVCIADVNNAAWASTG